MTHSRPHGVEGGGWGAGIAALPSQARAFPGSPSCLSDPAKSFPRWPGLGLISKKSWLWSFLIPLSLPLEKGRRCSSGKEPVWFCLSSDVWECPCQAPLQGCSPLPSHGVMEGFTLLPTLSIGGRFSAGNQATSRAKTSDRLCSALTSCVLLGHGLALKGRCSPRGPNPISWPVTSTQAKSRVSLEGAPHPFWKGGLVPPPVLFLFPATLPVVMYGYESWTVKKAERRRIDAFELWCWRRLLRVPWTARRSNQSILKKISPGCSLEGLMLKLKLQYSGHLMQRADSFEKTLMLGKIEGRRRRG